MKSSTYAKAALPLDSDINKANRSTMRPQSVEAVVVVVGVVVVAVVVAVVVVVVVALAVPLAVVFSISYHPDGI